MFRKSVFKRTVVGLFFSLLLVATATAQEKIALKKSFPVGTYGLEQSLFVSLLSSEGSKTTVTQSKTRLWWDVEAVESSVGEENEGGRTVRMSLRRLTFRNRNDGRRGDESLYDTEQALLLSNRLGKLYRKLQTMTAVVRLDRNLKVTVLEGPADFLKSLDGSEEEKAPEAAPLVAILKKVFTEATFREIFDQMFYLLPEESVTVGQKWTNNIKIELPLVGSTVIQWDSALSEVKGNRIAVVTGQVEIPLDPTTQIQSNMTAQYRLDNGLCAEMEARSVVTRTEKVTTSDGEKQVKTVGMVRSGQIFTLRHL